MNMVVNKGFQDDLGRRNIDTLVTILSIKRNTFGLFLFLMGFVFWNSVTN